MSLSITLDNMEKNDGIYGTIKNTIEFLLVYGTNQNHKKCTSEREGTSYWVSVEYTVNSAETALTGVWGYCAVSPTHKWSGTIKSF